MIRGGLRALAVLPLMLSAALAADCAPYPGGCNPAAQATTDPASGITTIDPCYCPWDTPMAANLARLRDYGVFTDVARAWSAPQVFPTIETTCTPGAGDCGLTLRQNTAAPGAVPSSYTLMQVRADGRAYLKAPGETGNGRRLLETGIETRVNGRAYATGDGATDDTAGLASALAAACPGQQGGTLVLPVGTYRLTSTLLVQYHQGCRIVCDGDAGQTHATVLRWDGANGGTVVQFDRTRDSTLEGCAIVAGTGTIGVALDVDHATSGPGGSVLSTNNLFRRLHISTSTTGIRVGNLSTSGNDLHTFEDVTIDGPGTYGYLIDDAQSKLHRLVRGAILQRTTGIYTTAGSFHADNVNFSGNTTDIRLGSLTDVVTITEPQSEDAMTFLTDGGTSAGGWAVTITGGRLSPHSAATNYLVYRQRGPLLIQGTDFRGGGYAASWRIQTGASSPGTMVTAISNLFPNPTVWNTATDVSVVNVLGNRCVLSDESIGNCT